MSLANPDAELEQSSGNAPVKSTLSQHIHDLSGSAVTANGFTGELEIARKQVLELMERLPADTDPELIKEMKFQLEDEMKHCLFRITESLSKLDHAIDRLKAG